MSDTCAIGLHHNYDEQVVRRLSNDLFRNKLVMPHPCKRYQELPEITMFEMEDVLQSDNVSIISISVKLENDLDYINQAIDDAKYISDLEADWDENGALEISKDTFGTAKNIVLKYSQYMFNYFSILLPAPSINPVNNGSIDLLWKNADKVLLLNIKPNETLAHYYGLNTHTKIDFQGSIRINEIETFFATWLMDFKMES